MRDHVGLEDEEAGSHEPRIVVGLWKLEKTKNQILPRSLQKGTQSCRYLDFSLARPVLDF